MSVSSATRPQIKTDFKPIDIEMVTKNTYAPVALSYLKTTKGVQKLLIKPLNLTFRTMKWLNSGLSPEWDNLYQVTKTASRVMKIAAFPSQCQKWISTASELREAISQKKAYKKIAKASAKVGLATTALTLPVVTAIELGEKASFYKLSGKVSSVLRGVKVAGFVGGLIGLGLGISKEVKRISSIQPFSLNAKDIKSLKEKEKALFSLLKLAKLVCAAVLLTLILLSFTMGLMIAPWVLLSLTAIGLSVGTGLYFYKQIHNPYNDPLLEAEKG